MINLYEYDCPSCDVVMQIQLSKIIEHGMGCLCGNSMNLVFHTEIDEEVFGSQENIEE